jgi:predicted CXXCH cytochrome family protein
MEHRPTALFLVLVLGAGCMSPAPRTPAPFLNVDSEVAFVGDEACFSCHEDEYQGFREHGMANSYYPLTPDNTVEEFPGIAIRDPSQGFIYRALKEDGRFFQEETLTAPDGTILHSLRREMKFVMGSGTAARTYFDMNSGYLYQLPLTWYTQEGKWDFSPGYRVANKRFERRAPERCLACHNSYPEAAPFADGKFLDTPRSIGCERCHGPGALHVAERLAVPEPAGSIDSTIVNPAHLTLARRLDVCQQCHLSATVSILRDGAGAFDFRPSHSLESHLALYAASETISEQEISVISHADRMQQSACFLETIDAGGSFECTTCHDPHSAFRPGGADYFNNTCLGCHESESLKGLAAHAPTANCVDCHMPRVDAVEAPHSSFTDHRIRVVSSRSPALAGTPSDGAALTAYFPSDTGSGDPTYEGMAYIVLGRQRGDQAFLTHGADLLDAANQGGALHGEAQFLRGLARLELGYPEMAIEGLEAAVAADGQSPERLNALAQAYEATRRSPARVEELYALAVSVQPARADIWVNYGRFLESRTRMDGAIRAYRMAVQEQPWLSTGHYNLGTALARNGEPEAARDALLQAAALDPKNPQIWGNLGAVYGQLGKSDSTGYAFERAVAMAPESALALGNLGAFYLNQNRFEQAIRFLGRAVDSDPGFADALANRALAHLRLGERASARLYARRALSAQRGHGLATQVLAALN